MDKYRQCIMWLTATFGAVTHHAKSFATPRLRLLDFFFLLKNFARNFFLTRNICSIFFLGFAQSPHQKSNGPPLTIRRTETIASFNMIVSIASKARDAGSSAMSLGQTIEFCACFANKPHKWMIFIRKVNLVPWYLLFLLILRYWETTRVPEDIVSLRKLDVTDLL